jgi:hypothetical protein
MDRDGVFFPPSLLEKRNAEMLPQDDHPLGNAAITSNMHHKIRRCVREEVSVLLVELLIVD